MAHNDELPASYGPVQAVISALYLGGGMMMCKFSEGKNMLQCEVILEDWGWQVDESQKIRKKYIRMCAHAWRNLAAKM